MDEIKPFVELGGVFCLGLAFAYILKQYMGSVEGRFTAMIDRCLEERKESDSRYAELLEKDIESRGELKTTVGELKTTVHHLSDVVGMLCNGNGAKR
jgi:hypothetical protein